MATSKINYHAMNNILFQNDKHNGDLVGISSQIMIITQKEPFASWSFVKQTYSYVGLTIRYDNIGAR